MPATTEATPSVLAMRRSAAGVTVVVSLSVSFAGTGSDVVADTVAVSVIGPSIVVVTTMSMVAVVPNGTTPSGQVTTPAAWRAAPLAGRRGDERHRAGKGVRDHDTRRIRGAEVRHGDGVRRRRLRPAPGSARSVFVMARSADDVTVSTSVAESSEGSVSATGLNVMDAVFATVGDAYPGGMNERELVGDRAERRDRRGRGARERPRRDRAVGLASRSRPSRPGSGPTRRRRPARSTDRRSSA